MEQNSCNDAGESTAPHPFKLKSRSSSQTNCLPPVLQTATSDNMNRSDDNVDNVPVNTLSVIEDGLRVVYLAATTRERKQTRICFEGSELIGEGSFGRVVKVWT